MRKTEGEAAPEEGVRLKSNRTHSTNDRLCAQERLLSEEGRGRGRGARAQLGERGREAGRIVWIGSIAIPDLSRIAVSGRYARTCAGLYSEPSEHRGRPPGPGGARVGGYTAKSRSRSWAEVPRAARCGEAMMLRSRCSKHFSAPAGRAWPGVPPPAVHCSGGAGTATATGLGSVEQLSLF